MLTKRVYEKQKLKYKQGAGTYILLLALISNKIMVKGTTKMTKNIDKILVFQIQLNSADNLTLFLKELSRLIISIFTG